MNFDLKWQQESLLLGNDMNVGARLLITHSWHKVYSLVDKKTKYFMVKVSSGTKNDDKLQTDSVLLFQCIFCLLANNSPIGPYLSDCLVTLNTNFSC